MDKVTSRGSAIALALVLATAAARAQAPAAKPAPAPAAAPAPTAANNAPPKPAAEMDQLKFFVGKWKCEGKAFASPMTGPEHAVKGSVDGKLDGDGHWQHWTYEEKKTKEHPGTKVHGMWGWDAANKRFVRSAADNAGVWDSATSPGLQGDKIVWTGELSGPIGKVPFHHTFTKKSDKEWTHALEVKTPDGKWVPSEEVTCKK